ncbi:MAG TPA: hypothetical protein VEC14_10050 [Reyranellaceae bacterium]|nr:hypothetical protein [Reyranellaceae bacterium]
MVCAADIRPAIAGEPDLLKRIEKAFAKAQDFWMDTSEGLRFNGALAAVLLETTDEAEKERVIASKRALDQLDAVLRAARLGIPADLSTLSTPPEDAIPLMKMWRAAKEAAA